MNFDWHTPTEDIVSYILAYLTTKYWGKGQMQDVISELPHHLKELFAQRGVI